MKICSNCGISQPLTEYHYKRGKTQNRCKACRSVYQAKHYQENKERERAVRKAWYEKNKAAVSVKNRAEYKANPEKFKFQRTLQKYGLTREQYQVMLSNQNNACGICKSIFVRSPYVDHCHETGKIRELLCSPCNTGFGLLREDVAIFKRCIAYARKYKK